MNFKNLKVPAFAGLLVLALSGVASAQSTTSGSTAAPANNANASSAPRDDDRGHDWGWIGLLGLAGLGGLMRRDRPTVVGTQSSVR